MKTVTKITVIENFKNVCMKLARLVLQRPCVAGKISLSAVVFSSGCISSLPKMSVP